ncbi:DUF4870 domain-containing protein [Streptomyces sp. NPDC058773]|uniref:DUF4870 domain-containing protein n=1 Tax=Streptomyces sp. NPDC058773 TaxID=3346632 RepID=UPI003681C1E8
MSDYHQPGQPHYGPPAGGPQQPYGTPQQGWPGAAPGGGYGYPGAPQPGAPQPGAFQAGGHGYGTPPPSPSSGPAMWSHLGALLTVTAGSMMCCGLGAFLGWIHPLTLRGNDRHKHDPYIRHHATQAVNYGITQAIMAALGTILYFTSALIFAAAATEEQRNGSGLAVPLITVIVIFGGYALAGVICAVIGTVKATRGELWTYPRLVAWPLSKG